MTGLFPGATLLIENVQFAGRLHIATAHSIKVKPGGRGVVPQPRPPLGGLAPAMLRSRGQLWCRRQVLQLSPLMPARPTFWPQQIRPLHTSPGLRAAPIVHKRTGPQPPAAAATTAASSGDRNQEFKAKERFFDNWPVLRHAPRGHRRLTSGVCGLTSRLVIVRSIPLSRPVLERLLCWDSPRAGWFWLISAVAAAGTAGWWAYSAADRRLHPSIQSALDLVEEAEWFQGMIRRHNKRVEEGEAKNSWPEDTRLSARPWVGGAVNKKRETADLSIWVRTPLGPARIRVRWLGLGASVRLWLCLARVACHFLVAVCHHRI